MGLIKLSTISRNGKEVSEVILVETSSISVPVIPINGGSLLFVSETLDRQVNPGINKDEYIVSESVQDVVNLLRNEIFIANVITRDGRSSLFTEAAFLIDNIVGNIRPNPLGSEFLYEEDGVYVPVKYVVSDTVDSIALSLQLPGGSSDRGVLYQDFICTDGQTDFVLKDVVLTDVKYSKRGSLQNDTVSFTVGSPNVTISPCVEGEEITFNF